MMSSSSSNHVALLGARKQQQHMLVLKQKPELQQPQKKQKKRKVQQLQQEGPLRPHGIWARCQQLVQQGCCCREQLVAVSGAVRVAVHWRCQQLQVKATMLLCQPTQLLLFWKFLL
jgi:hypothetical protein